MVYDEHGTPITATFADYAIPTAADAITLEASNTETPTPVNPLGAKGIGESATIGSTPAVQNAVVDALSHLGVTPHRPAVHPGAGLAGDPERADAPDLWREPPAAFDRCPSDGASPRSSRPDREPAATTSARMRSVDALVASAFLHLGRVRDRRPPLPGPARPAVEIDGLVMRYGDKVAVDGLDLTVERGTDHRRARAQRRRQDHDAGDLRGLPAAAGGHGARARARPGRASAASCSPGSA